MYEVNQKTLAAALGISARQIRNLKEQGMFECISGTKKYDLTECVREFIEFKIKAEAGGGASPNKEKEQAEHERVKKEISKLKLRKLRREVHEAADVEYFLTDMLQRFKSRLTAIPSSAAPELMGKTDVNEITEILASQVEKAISELGQYDAAAINKESESAWLEEDEEEEDNPIEN